MGVTGCLAGTIFIGSRYKPSTETPSTAPPVDQGPYIQSFFDSLESNQTAGRIICSPMLTALQAGSAEHMYLAAKDAEEACFNFASKTRNLEIPSAITGAARADCEAARKLTDEMLQCRAMMCSAIQKMVDAKGVGERAEASRALQEYGADVIQMEKDFISVRAKHLPSKKSEN